MHVPGGVRALKHFQSLVPLSKPRVNQRHRVRRHKSLARHGLERLQRLQCLLFPPQLCAPISSQPNHLAVAARSPPRFIQRLEGRLGVSQIPLHLRFPGRNHPCASSFPTPASSSTPPSGSTSACSIPATMSFSIATPSPPAPPTTTASAPPSRIPTSSFSSSACTRFRKAP